MQTNKDALDGFEVVHDRARVMTEYLIRVYDKLIGKAEVHDIDSDSAIAFIDVLLRVWRDLFPEEYEERLARQSSEWVVERTVQEANKVEGGYFVASFPNRVWQMLNIFFPMVKWTDRKNSNILTSNFPILKGTQYRT